MGDGSGGLRRRSLGWGATRILLYAGLVALLLIAGGFAVPAALEGTSEGLFAGSALTLGAAFLAGAVLLWKMDGRTAGAMGLGLTRSTAWELALGLGIGLAGIAVAAFVMFASGGLRYASQPGDAAGWFMVAAKSFGFFAVPAMAEEVLFRGYAFQVTVRVVGPVAGTLAASALFAVAHAANPSVAPLGLVNIFLAGVLLSAAYLRTRSLWFAGALHLGWNWGMAGPLDLPVSGLEMVDAPLYEPVIGGSAWVTGGPFGPEGGFVGTLAFTLALLAVLKLPMIRESPGMKALRPIVDEDETEGDDG
jgi:membrane protease YdiL (CAAX protease family)